MLSRAEQQVYDIIVAHYSTTSEFISSNRIAELMGVKKNNHIATQTRQLVVYGLLEQLDYGGNTPSNFLLTNKVPDDVVFSEHREKPLPKITEKQKRSWLRDLTGFDELGGLY